MSNGSQSGRGHSRDQFTTRELEIRILQNFVSCPGTTNSVEGIAAAWLGGEDSGRVSKALHKLVDRGAIGRLGVGESTVFFAMDPVTAQQMLHQYEGSGPAA